MADQQLAFAVIQSKAVALPQSCLKTNFSPVCYSRANKCLCLALTLAQLSTVPESENFYIFYIFFSHSSIITSDGIRDTGHCLMQCSNCTRLRNPMKAVCMAWYISSRCLKIWAASPSLNLKICCIAFTFSCQVLPC